LVIFLSILQGFYVGLVQNMRFQCGNLVKTHWKKPFNCCQFHCIENDTKTKWLTKGGTFHTSGKCTANELILLNEFYESKVIEWILYVNKTFGPHWYNMIIGHDWVSQLRIILDFDRQTTMWNKSTLKMKEYEDLLTLIHH
jgi:hypothetical protein